MSTEEAIVELTETYMVKWSEAPSATAAMLIDMSAKRVAEGESYEWALIGGHRGIRFLPK